MSAPILEVRDLQIAFAAPTGMARAVEGVSWHVHPGEMLGVVGESGCGKSVTAMAILGLLGRTRRTFIDGAILFRGENLLQASEERMQQIRGNEISMIFQDPMTSLNPVLSVGEQIAEVLVLHEGLALRAAWERACELLALVGIPDPQRRVREYPHQFSGGMRQRAMIAMALACKPAVLIADEPTTALDVTIQAQIMELLDRLRHETGTAIVLITHDLGVVAESCDRVAVMYAGKKVEEAAVRELFSAPSHPYTRGLLGAIPHLETPLTHPRPRLSEIPGMVPSLRSASTACRFLPRCGEATATCHAAVPALAPLPGSGAGHSVACWRIHPAQEKAAA